MRIAIGSLTYPLPNGVTNSINTSVDGFLKAGHEIMIISPEYELGVVRPEHYTVPSSLVEKTFLTILNRKERTYSPTATPEIKRLLANFDPDAFWLHSVSFSRNAFERVMIKSGKPSVLTYHTHVDVYGRIYGGVVGEQLMIKRSIDVCNAVDAIITPSQLMARDLEKFDIHKPMHVIPTAIAPVAEGYTKEQVRERFRIPKHNAILLSVGRVVVEKNIEAQFQMMEDLIKVHPHVTLLMIGPGDLNAAKRAITKHKIGRHVILAGQLPAAETRKLYSGCDVFVFTSVTETQGLVVGEAMSAGVPVVAMVAEVQEEMYPSSVAMIAQKESQLAPLVLEALEHPEKAQEMTHKAKEFVEDKFSLEKMISSQIGVFKGITSGQ